MPPPEKPRMEPHSAAVQPLGYLLMQVHRAFRAELENSLRPLGFTMPQAAVLFALACKSGLSTAALARQAFITPQAMGEVLTGLEAKGCVVRRAHDSHGRILPAELTKAGLDARGLCHAALAKAEVQMLSGLSADERGSLAGLLERCLARLHAASVEADRRAGPASAPSAIPKAQR